VVSVVADTANTVIDGIGSVGENAIHTVADLLTEIVGGVRQVAGTAFSGVRLNGRAGREQEFHAPDSSRRDQTTRREAAEEAAHAEESVH
jgi:hypothetical protein